VKGSKINSRVEVLAKPHKEPIDFIGGLEGLYGHLTGGGRPVLVGDAAEQGFHPKVGRAAGLDSPPLIAA